MAVAIFAEKPTADSLLRRRLELGWKPTPSSLRSRPEILGHAACLPHDLVDGGRVRRGIPPRPFDS